MTGTLQTAGWLRVYLLWLCNKPQARGPETRDLTA